MSFHRIYVLPLEKIYAIIFLALLFWTAIAVFVHHSGSKTVRCLWVLINALISVTFLIVILYYTVAGRAPETEKEIGFFRTIEQIKAKPELIREMIMNMFLFFPFGMTFSYSMDAVLRKKTKKAVYSVIITVGLSFVVSCVIEFMQYRYGLGNSEMSDIVMNTAGGALGSVSLCARNLIERKNKNRED